jgi:hypothetical protein
VLVVEQHEGGGGDRPDPPGQRLTRRSALKVVLSSELPRSAGARVRAPMPVPRRRRSAISRSVSRVAVASGTSSVAE